jgi:hypothetical protein
MAHINPSSQHTFKRTSKYNKNNPQPSIYNGSIKNNSKKRKNPTSFNKRANRKNN